MLLIGQEQVPESLLASLLAHLDDDLGIGDAGLDLVVEGGHRFRLHRVDVLIHERADLIGQFLDARAL